VFFPYGDILSMKNRTHCTPYRLMLIRVGLFLFSFFFKVRVVFRLMVLNGFS
jgi:hypothetical protein